VFIINFLKRCASYCYKQDILFVYCCDNAQVLKTVPPMPAGLTTHVCDRDNIEQVKALVKPLPRLTETSVKRNDLALLAALGRKWIFRSSVVLGPKEYHVAGFPLRLTETDAYLEGAETIPTWRGKGVAPGMLRVTMEALLARGYTRSFLTIAITNTSSCRAIEKGGAERIGIISGHRLFGRWQAAYIPLLKNGLYDIAR